MTSLFLLFVRVSTFKVNTSRFSETDLKSGQDVRHNTDCKTPTKTKKRKLIKITAENEIPRRLTGRTTESDRKETENYDIVPMCPFIFNTGGTPFSLKTLVYSDPSVVTRNYLTHKSTGPSEREI